MKRTFAEAMAHRRSYYSIGSDLSVLDEEIVHIIREAVKNVPSAFNSQSTRIVLLLGDEHKKLWNIVKETLKARISAEVRNVFKITGAGVIAGCYVTDGKVQRNAQVRLLRDNVVVFEGKLSSLKHYKEDVKEMAAGFECGMSLEGHNDIKEGDVVECFIMEEIPR
mgnify:CR=1 FL=1